MTTKKELEVTVEAYRAENESLHKQLEERGSPHNMCDDIVEFFDACTKYAGEAYDTTAQCVEDAYDSTKSFIVRS